MTILIIASELQQTEFLSQSMTDTNDVAWVRQLPHDAYRYDVLIDLQPLPSSQMIQQLAGTGVSLIFINAPELPVGSNSFCLINGWPGFLGKPILECCSGSDSVVAAATAALHQLNRQVAWTTNTTGFISQRVIAGIINEAFLVAEEGTGTEQDINTAMILGTNYPHGPFEWARFIGYANVLAVLCGTVCGRSIYEPSTLLKQKALAQ